MDMYQDHTAVDEFEDACDKDEIHVDGAFLLQEFNGNNCINVNNYLQMKLQHIRKRIQSYKDLTGENRVPLAFSRRLDTLTKLRTANPLVLTKFVRNEIETRVALDQLTDTQYARLRDIMHSTNLLAQG